MVAPELTAVKKPNVPYLEPYPHRARRPATFEHGKAQAGRARTVGTKPSHGTVVAVRLHTSISRWSRTKRRSPQPTERGVCFRFGVDIGATEEATMYKGAAAVRRGPRDGPPLPATACQNGARWAARARATRRSRRASSR